MKNYEEMSDFEINMSVTCEVFICHGWSISDSGGSFYHCGIDGSGYFIQHVIDYCNNPSDAWPIIMRNKISIFPTGLESDIWRAESYFIDCVKHSNPLRAAMIVFLMMQDAKK